MIAQKNVTAMLVGKDLAMLGETSKRSDLATGQLAVFKVGSTTAIDGTTDLVAGDKFTIVTKNTKGVLVETPVIEYDNITSKKSVAYAAPTQRSRAIGFNGTSGSIEVSNSTNYVTHTFWKDNSKTWGCNAEPVKYAAYKSDASATQAEIAAGVVASYVKNAQRENPKILKAEVLINSAGTAVPTGVDTIAFTKGSKYFTATDIDDATGTSAIAVGDFIRIGTAVTDPCYKITALDTTNNIGTIDTVFQGTSVSGVDTTYELVIAATAATADCGIKITALATTDDFEPGLIRYDFTEFEIQLNDGFGTSDVSSITTPSLGSGTYWEVAQTEWFLKGNRGEPWRVGSYPKTIPLEATSGKTYDYVSLEYNTGSVNGLDHSVKSFGSVLVALEDEDDATATTQLKDILNIS